MDPELWQRIEPLYRAALQTPPEKRSSYIAGACGSDAALRHELERLFETGSGDTSLDPHTPGSGTGEFIPRSTGTLTPGQVLLGRFNIVGLLGSGGMGDVYEATDLELGRIALKTIRGHIAGNPEMLSRFKKEVQLARKVSGPHVCRIHELFVISGGAGSDGRVTPSPRTPPYGTPTSNTPSPATPPPGESEAPDAVFLTMEFLEGLTLSDTITQSGPLAPAEAQKLALAICDGLGMIHSAGIVHRDLKSRNIMVAMRNGVPTPVLMDFGLALEVVGRGAQVATTITGPGAIVGTPDYMAPEQFQGRHVTPATDVYALGIILYEMVTGKQPFSAPTPFENAVLRGRPFVPPSSLKKQLPRRWDEVIRKCLQFDPALRYQSAAAVADALRGRRVVVSFPHKGRWAIYAALALVLGLLTASIMPAVRQRVHGMIFSSRQKHIAVLPLDFVSEDAQTEALGNGLMDSLSGELSNLSAGDQALWVIPASEVRNKNVKDAAGALRQFGATIVVKGSVQRQGMAVHLALTVIDTKKMRQIGFTEVDSATGDMEGIENEAVERLGRLMNVSSSSISSEIVGPTNPAAYEDYLTGLGYIERYDKPGYLDLAIASLNKAVATDDHFALGLAKIAEAYRLKYQLDRDAHWLVEAQSYCARAVAIDPHLPAVFITLARIHESTGKYDLAVQEFQKALDIDPRNSDALTGLAKADDNAGRLVEAEANFKRAIALRPDYWDVYEELGNFYDSHGKSQLAIEQYRKAIALTPDNEQVYANLGGAYVNLEDPKLYGEGENALKKSIELSPENYAAYTNLGYLYTVEQRYAEAAAANEHALQINDKDYRVWANALAAYEWLHEGQKAAFARQKMLPLLLEEEKLNPRDAQVEGTLAGIYAQEKENDKVYSHLASALALAPNDPDILSTAADVYEVMGDHRRAIEYLNQSFALGHSRAQFLGDPDLISLVGNKDIHLPRH
ncbi:MAG TPA: protein kinase [Acidisarcina sp.]